MLVALFVLGGGLIAFGLSTSFALSAAMLFAVGAGQMVYNNLRQTFVQGLVADEMRGRVLSLLTLSTFGLQPLGAVEVGALASLVGPGPSVLLNGLVCALLAVLVWLRFPRIRALA